MGESNDYIEQEFKGNRAFVTNGCLLKSMLGILMCLCIIWSSFGKKNHKEEELTFLSFKITEIKRLGEGSRGWTWAIRNVDFSQNFVLPFAEKDSKLNLYIRGKKIQKDDFIKIGVVKSVLETGCIDKIDVLSLTLIPIDSLYEKIDLWTLKDSNEMIKSQNTFARAFGYIGILIIVLLTWRFWKVPLD